VDTRLHGAGWTFAITVRDIFQKIVLHDFSFFDIAFLSYFVLYRSNNPMGEVEPLMLSEMVGPFQVFVGLLFACTVSAVIELFANLRNFKRHRKSIRSASAAGEG
jgi:hypothetical protein